MEILLTLDRMGIEHLIKYSLFDKEQKKKYKESDRNLDNWTYDETTDTYTHPESWVYQFDHLKHRHSTTGFRQENMVYKAEQADLAPQKGLYVNGKYQLLKVKEIQASGKK